MGRLVVDSTYAEIEGLHPQLQKFVRALVDFCRRGGWAVEIRKLGGLRSAAEQATLYAQGRTRSGPIVTNARVSLHQAGRAFDLDLVGRNRADLIPLLRILGPWWKTQGGRWGGDYGDYGHFEV
jgi:peptidoglycan L-alanyl-D-glutamate endopeptidase CwlK